MLACRTAVRQAEHRILVYRLTDGVLYLEYRLMSSAFFSSRALRSCFSVAACIWHCYSTPPAHGAHYIPD
jgi:hypothetical protein